MKESYWGSYWKRRNSRRTFLIGGATVAAGSAGLIAVGCGGNDDDDEATTAGDAPVRGGTLHLSKPQIDDGIDPGLKVINNNEILARIYNHTHLYKLSTNEFLFDAATSIEQPDNLTITFPLRSGMTFHHDGSAVTAEDVANTWNRFPDLLENQGSQVNEANWASSSRSKRSTAPPLK